MSLEEYEVIEPSSRDLLNGDLRSILLDEGRKSAMERTRRAESTAKALEAILLAKSEEVPEPLSQFGPVAMASEDYRSRLISSMEEVGKLRCELSELLNQQQADSDNIESLQLSLERLHALVSDYRKAKDDTDKQLMDLADVVRSHCGDSTVSVEEVKRQLTLGTLIVTSHEEAGVREELEMQLSKWAEWSDEVTAELASKDEENQELRKSINSAQKDIAELTIRLEKDQQVIVELKSQAHALPEMKGELESRNAEIVQLQGEIEQWSVWAESMKGSGEEIDRLANLAETREVEIKRLETCATEKDREIDYLAKLIEARDSDLNRLTGEIGQRDDEMLNFKTEVVLLKDELTAKETEIASLSQKLEDQAKGDKKELEELDSLRREIETREDELARLNEYVTNIEANQGPELEGLRSDMEALRAAKSMEIESLRDHIVSLEAQVDRVHKLESEVAMAHDNLVAKNAEMSELESLQTMQLNELKHQISIKDEEIVKLKDYMRAQREAQLEEKESSDESDRLKSEIAEMESKLSEWAAWADSVTNELKLRDESEAHLLQQLDAFKREKESLKTFSVSTATTGDLENNNKLMVQENEEEDILELKHRLESADELLLEFQYQVAELTAQIQNMNDREAEVGILTDENELLKLQIESTDQDASNKLVELTSQLAVRDATIKALYDNINTRVKVDQDSSPIHSHHPPQPKILLDQDPSPLSATLKDQHSSPLVVPGKKILLDQDSSPLHLPVSHLPGNEDGFGELQTAKDEIEALKEKIASLIIHQDAVEDARINAEESVTLLAAYRDEIDRLSKENAHLRSTASPQSSNNWWGSSSSPASRARSAPSKQ